MTIRALAALSLVAAMATSVTPLQAQGVDVRIGVPGFYGGFYSRPDYYQYGRRGGYYRDDDWRYERYAPRRSPRVYGYVQRNDQPTLRISPGGCGTYRFWDGSSCVDARGR